MRMFLMFPIMCILQKDLVEAVDGWLDQGKEGKLYGKTYTPVPPNFAYRQQSRQMLQFGIYTHSNRVEVNARVAPMPPQLRRVIQHLVSTGALPQVRSRTGKDECPWCCTINIYEPGQWIPHHIDNHKFKRPFATLSLLSEEVREYTHARRVHFLTMF